MAFFDKIGETISSKSKGVAQKAKDMAEVSDLNKQINQCNQKINESYMEIGYYYYQAHKDDGDDPFAAQCANIRQAMEQADALRSQIQVIKGVKVCPNCHAEIPRDSQFCGYCGYRLAAPAPQQPQPQQPYPPQAPQPQQPQPVGHGAGALAQPPGEGFLRHRELAQDALVGFRLLKRVELFALQIFNQRDERRFRVGRVQNHRVGKFRAQKLQRAQPSFARDQFVFARSRAPHHQRREQTILLDGLRQFRNPIVGKRAARLARIGPDAQ